MVESWLLTDREAMAEFLRIAVANLPADPDREEHPKRTLVNLARKSRAREVREDLVPEAGSPGVVGKNYTPRMTQFVEDHWRPLEAEKRSASLRRAVAALRKTLDL
jgi:hypothetical protein